jgi:outer membrane receptor protein involved in Fe transport
MMIWAQAETGQITGTVLDSTGAAIPKATVTIRNIDSGAIRTAVASGEGSYTATNLQPGNYEVSVTSAGFTTFKQNVVVTVGGKVAVDAKLSVGTAATTVEVSEVAAAVKVNTETQTISQVIDTKALTELPTITRNPYSLIVTAGTVSEDDPSGRGAGVSINGLRSAGTNIMLDGVANNDEFVAGVGQMTPLDSVQEVGIITNNFTAEYGRASAGIINVTTKSGGNSFHGTIYEFNRVSALASNGFNNNANGLPKSEYDRNQFGYSVGGPAIKNKLFFFDNTEWIRVRSSANLQALVPDPSLIAASSAGTRSVFSQFGTIAPGVAVLQTFNRTQAENELGQDPCAGSAKNGPCLAYGSTAPMLDLVNYNVPSNSGAGSPQNTYLMAARVDYNLSDKTQIYTRYALYSEDDFAGTISNSPYAGFNTGQTIFNNALIVSLTHTFTPALVSQSKLDFNRLNNLQPLASGGVIPDYYLGSANGATNLGNYSVALPGYNPFSPASGIPFGGPQNFGEAYQDFSWVHGKHEIRFGGTFEYLRDNRTFGAYEEGQQIFGNSVGKGLDGLLGGQVYEFQGAIYPQGKYPCVNGVQTPACTVTLPLGPPTFERSNRYEEGALYVQDSWKISRRVTVNLGLRWEYFGVQHNVNANLDSNFYPSNNSNQFQAIASGAVMPAPMSPIGELWTPSKKNFAPRIGFAWDVFGDGKTSFRGGYGIGYERNFGNVTYNVLFNPPNYAVVDLIAGSNISSIPVSNLNFGPLGGSAGSAALPPSELRAIQPNIAQSYAHLISASAEHQFGNATHLEVDYSASIGENLYDIGGTNIPGMGNLYLGIPCTPGDTLTGGPNPCSAPLNTQYGGINRRGSGGISNYNALNIRYDIRDIRHSGLTLRMNYTWSHAMDELSDTFSSSTNQFNLGYTNAFTPMLDYGPAQFDNRHRIAVSAIYELPFARHLHGVAKGVLDGWEFTPIFTARTGAPYTIYDISNDYYIYTRVAADQVIPVNGNLPGRPSQGVNTFGIMDFSKIAVNENYLNPITGSGDFGPFPGNYTGRDYFHTPGTFDFDLGIYKNTKITEHATLQLRLEAYNAINHANFGINTGSAYIFGGSGLITGSYNGNRNIQIGGKIIF